MSAREPTEFERRYQAWRASDAGRRAYAEMVALLDAIPLDPPRVRAARRKAIS